MEALNDLIMSWTTHRDVEILMQSGILDNQKAIQDGLDKRSGEEKEKALAILFEISSALTAYIADLDAKKSDIKAQMEQNEKSAKACLSYGSAAGLQGKGRDKS